MSHLFNDTKLQLYFFISNCSAMVGGVQKIMALGKTYKNIISFYVPFVLICKHMVLLNRCTFYVLTNKKLIK